MRPVEFWGLLSMAFVTWFTWFEATRKNQGSGQTKRMSLVEAWANIVLGFSVNLVGNIVIIPMMTDGHGATLAGNFWGGWIFTTVSLVRQYSIRRFFSNHIHRFAAWVTSRFA